MAELTLYQITEAGSAVTYASATAEGDTVDNGGSTFLHIKNGNASTRTVTITAQTTSVDSSIYGDLTKANASIVVGAGAESVIGPFKTSSFNNADGEIAITYSAVTDLTIVAFYITAAQL